MSAPRHLHGRIKRFGIFMVITSLLAFVSNSTVQFFTKGEVDFSGALTNSILLGIVLSVLMVTLFTKSKAR